MSVFIACVPQPECAAQLRTLIEALRIHLPHSVTWRNSRQWHVTVRYLGDALRAPETPLLEALQGVALQHSPFDLRLDRLEFWPRPKVWVLRASQSTPFTALSADIENAVRGCGYAAEKKAVTPHLTLAYARSREATPIKAPVSLPIALHVPELMLLKTIPGAYAHLHSWPLSGENAI